VNFLLCVNVSARRYASDFVALSAWRKLTYEKISHARVSLNVEATGSIPAPGTAWITDWIRIDRLRRKSTGRIRGLS
jgi:hypothetical protein